MEPINPIKIGQKAIPETKSVSAEPARILADKIEEELRELDLWDEEVMGSGFAEDLDDKLLQEAVWVLLNVFLETKNDPADLSKYTALQNAGSQCRLLIGDGASDTLLSVLEALTFRFEPVFEEVEEGLERVAQGRKKDSSTNNPRNDFERYYSNEGFRQLPRSPSVWTDIEVGMPSSTWETGEEGSLTMRMRLAFPGQKEFTTEIALPWGDASHPDLEGTPPKAMCLAMAEVMGGEEVDGPLGRVAAEWVDRLRDRVFELVRIGHTPEEVSSTTVVSTLDQRVDEVKNENRQLLEVFDQFSNKIDETLPLAEEAKQALDALKERVEGETRIDRAIFVNHMLRVVIPTAVDIRSHFIGGDPLTYEDRRVLRAIGEIAQMRETLDDPDEKLSALVFNLSNGLIMSAALHPAAKVAFEAGMDPRDVLKYSGRLQQRENTINQLMMAVAKARSRAPFTTDYRVFKTEQMAKINELRNRIAREEDIAKDEEFGEILGKINQIISEVKAEAKRFDTTLNRFMDIVPMSDDDLGKLKRLCSEFPDSAPYRQAVMDYMNFVIKQHDRIRESLVEEGALPADMLEIIEKNGEMGNAVNLKFPEVFDDELITFSVTWSRKLTNHAIFHNYQIFSDTAKIHGFDLETFRKHFELGRDKLSRFYVKGPPPYKDAERVQEQIGLYHPFESQLNEREILLRKTDWQADDWELEENGKPYFRKGKVILGKAKFDPNSEKWQAIRDISVELDLTTLPFLMNRETTEAYFDFFEATIANDLESTKQALNKAWKERPKLQDLFTEEEIERLAEHQHEFMHRVLEGLYKVHYAVMHPKDSIPGVDVLGDVFKLS